MVAQRSDGEEGALQVREDVGTAGIARQVRERQEAGVRGLDDATVWQRDTDTDGVMSNILEGVGIGEGDEVAGGAGVCIEECGCVCVCRRRGSDCISRID